MLTDHQALLLLIKRNRSNKTYSTRLTRWLDRQAHFGMKTKHVGAEPFGSQRLFEQKSDIREGPN